MSKLRDDLKAIRIFNNWELLVRFGTANDVAIEYHCPAPGRAGWGDSRKTNVWSPRNHPKLDEPKRLESGFRRTFTGSRRESFPVALQWAIGEFGSFVPSPFGGQITKGVLRRAKEDLKTSACA